MSMDGKLDWIGEGEGLRVELEALGLAGDMMWLGLIGGMFS